MSFTCYTRRSCFAFTITMLWCFGIEMQVATKGLGYLSTPPMSEHRSALSTSGNMSNLRSARYTVVDLSKKKKKTSNKLLTRTALTTLSLNLIFAETNGPRWEKKYSA